MLFLALGRSYTHDHLQSIETVSPVICADVRRTQQARRENQDLETSFLFEGFSENKLSSFKGRTCKLLCAHRALSEVPK